MKERFADTFLFRAVMNPRDAKHARAMESLGDPRQRLITTSWVWAEVANAMSAPGARSRAAVLWDRVRADPRFEMVHVSEDLVRASMTLYRERPDKGWSLTECVSFRVMEARGIAEALTGDQHFSQAGFFALLA